MATNLPYAPPLHLQPALRHLGYAPGDFPVAERAAARLLGVPVGPHLTGAMLERVASALGGAA